MEEIFEVGKTYIFYFGSQEGRRQATGTIVSWEHPLAKVETEGLVRIINCASADFLEAVLRREEEEGAPEPIGA